MTIYIGKWRHGLCSLSATIAIATLSISSTAFADARTLALLDAELGSTCFASGVSQTRALQQFNADCGGIATSCAMHRRQWVCSSGVLEIKPVTIREPDVVTDETPFVSGLTLVSQWNELALDAVRSGKAKPTLTAYQLFLVSAAMYDAYTTYDSSAAPYSLVPGSVDKGGESDAAALHEAVSQAAYRALVYLFPAYENRYGYFHQYLADLGYKPLSGAASEAQLSYGPSAVGFQAVRAFVEARRHDGSGLLNGFRESSTLVYPDPYEPVNSPDPIADTGEFGADFNPNHWQPLRVPTGTVVDEADQPVIDSLNLDSFGDQQFLSPHWGGVTPFALDFGAQLRPAPPPRYGSDAPYTDGLGITSTNTEAYVRQITQVLAYSADLTDRQKIIAEFWADGPRTESPPGHWNQIAHGIVDRDDLSTADTIKLFFALNAALLDASIATWEAKRHYDYIRPASAIRWYFQDQPVLAWGGPDRGTQTISGEQWSPYQKLDFVTPPFPEYVSGHSTFSRAAAEVLKRFTGSDRFYDGVTRTRQDVDEDGRPDLLGQFIAKAGSFQIEAGPRQPVVLQWPTFTAAADEAGISRLYGGIHIQDGDLRGRELGRVIGERVYQRALDYFAGRSPEF